LRPASERWVRWTPAPPRLPGQEPGGTIADGTAVAHGASMTDAFLVLFLWFFPQAAPQTAPSPSVEEPYYQISLKEPDVRAAVKAALNGSHQKGKLISAERNAISGNNIRLCISTNRSGSYEFARVDLAHNPAKKKWEVLVWSWGSCGR